MQRNKKKISLYIYTYFSLSFIVKILNQVIRKFNRLFVNLRSHPSPRKAQVSCLIPQIILVALEICFTVSYSILLFFSLSIWQSFLFFKLNYSKILTKWICNLNFLYICLSQLFSMFFLCFPQGPQKEPGCALYLANF